MQTHLASTAKSRKGSGGGAQYKMSLASTELGTESRSRGLSLRPELKLEPSILDRGGRES